MYRCDFYGTTIIDIIAFVNGDTLPKTNRKTSSKLYLYPKNHGISKLVVWRSKRTLQKNTSKPFEIAGSSDSLGNAYHHPKRTIVFLDHYINNCCFTKHPFKNGCLGYQVGVISLHLQLGILEDYGSVFCHEADVDWIEPAGPEVPPQQEMCFWFGVF